MPDGHAACYLLIDVGGHAARAALVDAAGRCGPLHERPLATHRAEGGVVEHDAEAVLAAVHGAVASLVSESAVHLPRVVAAGFACQRASVVAWDRTDGRPLGPVLSWADSRAADLLAAAQLDVAAASAISGLRPTAFFGASKLVWLWRHQPAVRAAAAAGRLAWGPLASFLLYRLLIERPYTISASLAQRTLLFDVRRGCWSAPLCAAFAIDAASLPTVFPDLHAYGHLRLAEQVVPLVVAAGDQNLVPLALGQAPDRLALNLGTGAFLFAPPAATSAAPSALLCSVLPSAALRPALALEGTVNGAGAAFDWLATQWGVADLPWEALTVPQPDAPLFLNRVGGLGSPLWQPGGESRFDRPPRDLAEAMAAVADSIAFLIQLNLDALRGHGVSPRGIDAGGGLCRSDGLCQRIADLSGLPLRRNDDAELTLRGLWRLLATPGATAEAGKGGEFVPGPLAAARRGRYRAWCAAMGAPATA